MHFDDARKIKAKLKNQALHCLWLGHANSYDIDTYHILHLKTRQVMLTQDTVLMKRSYFYEEKDNKQKKTLLTNIMLKNKQI